MANLAYKGCVYRATLIRTGKCYIGKTLVGIRQRRNVHYWHARHGLQTPFAHALMAYVDEAFSWEELFCSNDDSLLKAVEIEQISLHRASGVQLYNISAGGDGCNGVKWTPEERERRMAENARRRQLGLTRKSDAQKEKQSAAMKGRAVNPMTAETRSKISAAKQAYWANKPADHPARKALTGRPKRPLP